MLQSPTAVTSLGAQFWSLTHRGMQKPSEKKQNMSNDSLKKGRDSSPKRFNCHEVFETKFDVDAVVRAPTREKKRYEMMRDEPKTVELQYKSFVSTWSLLKVLSRKISDMQDNLNFRS